MKIAEREQQILRVKSQSVREWQILQPYQRGLNSLLD